LLYTQPLPPSLILPPPSFEKASAPTPHLQPHLQPAAERVKTSLSPDAASEHYTSPWPCPCSCSGASRAPYCRGCTSSRVAFATCKQLSGHQPFNGVRTAAICTSTQNVRPCLFFVVAAPAAELPSPPVSSWLDISHSMAYGLQQYAQPRKTCGHASSSLWLHQQPSRLRHL